MRKLFILSSIFLLILAGGCKTSLPSASNEENDDTPVQAADQTQQKIFNKTMQKVKIGLKKENFSIENVKFSLDIPENFKVSDYSKIYHGINILDEELKHSLQVTIEKFENKKIEDVKQDFMSNAAEDGSVKVAQWHKTGYELVFERSGAVKDYMVVINRTFLLPVENYYFVMNEIVDSAGDHSLSEKIKALADSLETR